MGVKKEPSGRRSVQVEVEVPGTPEEVWHAIATGPGISSWFVPAEFEIVDGKPVAVKMNFGPGMESSSAVTEWDPLHKWAGKSDGWAPGMPGIANEWIVEARDGGVCIVRIVTSLFSDTDDWDGQLEATESGWPGFFRTLRLYMTHFRGQRSAIMQKMAFASGTEAEAWTALLSALGLQNVTVGQRCATNTDGLGFSGMVEHYTERPWDLLIRLDQPSPGVAAVGAYNCGGPVMIGLNFYLYGDQSAATAARESPHWDAWFQRHFPAPATPEEGG